MHSLFNRLSIDGVKEILNFRINKRDPYFYKSKQGSMKRALKKRPLHEFDEEELQKYWEKYPQLREKILSLS